MSRSLLIAPQWLGDAVMTHSLIQLMAQDASVDVLCADWIQPVYERMPEVEHVIPVALKHGALSLKLYWRTAKALKNNYDQCFIVPRKLKAALIPWMAHIPVRIGYLGESRYGLINRRVIKNPRHAFWIQQVCALYDEQIASDQCYPLPKLNIDIQNQQGWRETLHLQQKKLVCLMPGASYGPSKQWPVESFKSLASSLSKKYILVVLGGKAEQNLGAIISHGQQHIINLCGKTSLEDTIDLLALSEFCVTNDSGLMHIAAATGCFVKALYGSSSPEYTPPLTDKKHIFSDALSCKPCFKRHCEFEHYDCWKKITAERVLTSDEY